MSKNTLELLQDYDWPGNIRELQNVVERAVILCDDEIFTVEDAWLHRESPAASIPPSASVAECDKEFAARERAMIESALVGCRGRVSGPNGAAAKLGLPRQTLDYKIKSLRINRYHFKEE